MDITIKLTLEQWNAILDILSDATVRRALPLINAIVAQGKEQVPQETFPLPTTNGAVLKD